MSLPPTVVAETLVYCTSGRGQLLPTHFISMVTIYPDPWFEDNLQELADWIHSLCWGYIKGMVITDHTISFKTTRLMDRTWYADAFCITSDCIYITLDRSV